DYYCQVWDFSGTHDVF
nr:immunoglobulin light chain junction region [Macaca mulatta]MOV95508.1 immunoglobulin light chain junction region [Macaca mulatta]MOV95860.1 immunoglobulin light chain junction region [Macaca mulatta]MOV96144.1 immunoglobulin light chain junction region [Macaca mulatta]MOV96498.1 immunoglobulin light chain junction region [Macaca mulatta]